MNNEKSVLQWIILVILLLVLAILCLMYFHKNTENPVPIVNDRAQVHANENTELVAASKLVLSALKNKDYVALQKLVSDNGLSMNLYPDELSKDKGYIPKADIANIAGDKNIYVFGYTDGKGDEIKLTRREYIEKWIYNNDYLNAPKMVVRGLVHEAGNVPNNIAAMTNGRNFVSFGFDSTVAGNNNPMSWTAIYLIFNYQNDEYKLMGILKDNWTI